MADARLESIQGHVSALGAPASERGSTAQLLAERAFPELEFRDLARRLSRRLDGGQSCGERRVDVRTDTPT